MSRNPAGYEFIELYRTFHELSEHSDEGYEVDISRTFSVGDPLRWPNLIEEYRLIILSEAGAGKTAEIFNAAHTLKGQGKPAFFLRLESIPEDFEDAFEVGSSEAFEAWLASGDDGWLFLDSVDEARLRSPGDFELAIRKLSRRIKTAKDRTHIIITGRTTAWRPKTDLSYCTYHLPYTLMITSESDSQDEDAVPEGSLQTTTKLQNAPKTPFKIVALDDLTADQIAVFAKARGINSKSFLDAVERADAWSFTSRPQDLEELADFWIDKGRIGTRLEIMRNSIDRRLQERDQGRADALPLSAERARKGARLLAAATTLVHDPTIRVPDGTKNSKGIAVNSVLLDWNDKDQSILLSRPIFDEAIYGAVRFHHRSVREYLAAEWLTELLKRETSRRTIEGLFFRNQYGLEIVVPKLRPILPWLVILDEKIRERVRKVAPEIIFEGGDPSQLPLEVRRYILHEVCEQMANSAAGRSMHDYAAVQRFANPDLTDDVCTLIRKYADNEDLIAFLFRMVWLGRLTGALAEAMNVALTPTADYYARSTAFRAINAIGLYEDQEHVRQIFLSEASELNRGWLAELLEGVQPTEQTLVWLLACLEKCAPNERYTVDHLQTGVTEFVDTADIDLVPQFVVGLNRLLSLPPVIEHRYCEVSEKFKWLMIPASKAVERLVLVRHPSSLESHSLAILHKFSAVRGYESNELSEVKTEYKNLVPAWQELNRALFWFEVQRAREANDKKRGTRLTDFWRVSFFESFWRFEECDFEYAAEEISNQTLSDDKLVALSLAFGLYKAANRPPVWRKRLKRLVDGNDELSARLRTYLKPPAQDEDSRRWKKQDAKWKKRIEVDRKKKEEYHAGWRKYLKDNLYENQAALQKTPGTLTNSLHYLFEQSRKENTTGRWTEYNWKSLIAEYGEEVARFYRDGIVSFWRNYEPKLRSEGAPINQTPLAVIIGLTGLEVEAHETKNWPKNLEAAEIKRACKYASYELNGFPTWFPKLFEMYPNIVSDFLMREVRYELSIEKTDTDLNYILSDISWSGQWAWDQIVPSIYEHLKATEPKNLANLHNMLKILQESILSDDLIEELASRKCKSLKKLDHLSRWYAVWVRVSPDIAIAALKSRIAKIAPKKRTLFAMNFITHLLDGRRGDGTDVRQAFKKPQHLKSLYLLMHEHIRRDEDTDRVGKGAYSPGLRDNAQEARDNLFELLVKIPGKESFFALKDIAMTYPVEKYRSWMMLHAKRKAEQDGDIAPWSPSQVSEFNEWLERTPHNNKELAELAILRLLDLKDDLEHGDSSISDILKKVTKETDMRKYIGRELRDKAFGRYSIPQEEEFSDAKKPDLRFHGTGFDEPVPVELKLADNWTGPDLIERLENQLCGDYLRDNRSSRGIFVLVYRGDKAGWEVPGSKVDFAGLTKALEDHWQLISFKFPKVEDIIVIGIDLTKRSG